MQIRMVSASNTHSPQPPASGFFAKKADQSAAETSITFASPVGVPQRFVSCCGNLHLAAETTLTPCPRNRSAARSGGMPVSSHWTTPVS